MGALGGDLNCNDLYYFGRLGCFSAPVYIHAI
jgi:hypothetical protein